MTQTPGRPLLPFARDSTLHTLGTYLHLRSTRAIRLGAGGVADEWVTNDDWD